MTDQADHYSRPTLADIAERVGVSAMTVSLALRGEARVSRKRRQEIERVAREMNYQPQIAAQLLRRRKTGHIGLLMGNAEMVDQSSGFFIPIMTHFVRLCEEEGIGYHIEFFQRGDEFLPPKQLVGGLVDGTIVSGYVDGELRDWLLGQEQFPWVAIEEPAPLSVSSATDRAAYMAVQHLAALGHRRIAYCGGIRYSMHRLARTGFLHAATDFSLALEDNWLFETELDGIDNVHQRICAWASHLLAQPSRPTAIYAHSLRVARCIVYEALRAGVRIPEDLSIIGYGRGAEAQLTAPILSLIEADFATMVGKSVDLLRKRIDGKQVKDQTLWVEPRLKMYETVAPPPS